jgi:hypothetical protein
MARFFETYDEAWDYIERQADTGLRIVTHYDDRRNRYEVVDP